MVFDRLEKELGTYEFLPQWDVNLIVSHINSTPRESLAGETPYASALRICGESALKILQLKAGGFR